MGRYFWLDGWMNDIWIDIDEWMDRDRYIDINIVTLLSHYLSLILSVINIITSSLLSSSSSKYNRECEGRQ